MQLHRTEYERNFSLLWLSLATVTCYLNCLSVPSLHTHSEQLAEFTAIIYVFLCQTFTTHSMPSNSSFRRNCREADCFQATPTLLMTLQYVCTTPHYQLFSLNTVSPFPFPHRYRRPWQLTETSIKLIIFCSLRLKHQVWTVRDIHPMAAEVRLEMYMAL